MVVGSGVQEICEGQPGTGTRPGIGCAVALGWQVTQLFHSPVHRGPASDPVRGGHLPGRSEFPGASQSVSRYSQAPGSPRRARIRPMVPCGIIRLTGEASTRRSAVPLSATASSQRPSRSRVAVRTPWRQLR